MSSQAWIARELMYVVFTPSLYAQLHVHLAVLPGVETTSNYLCDLCNRRPLWHEVSAPVLRDNNDTSKASLFREMKREVASTDEEYEVATLSAE